METHLIDDDSGICEKDSNETFAIQTGEPNERLEELITALRLELEEVYVAGMGTSERGKGKQRARDGDNSGTDLDKTVEQNTPLPRLRIPPARRDSDSPSQPTPSTSRAPPANNRQLRSNQQPQRLPPAQPPSNRGHQLRSNAEDPDLIDKLADMILQNKLRDVTPAHIFASSGPIRQKLIEYLKTQRVTVANIQLADSDGTTPTIVAENHLPLKVVDCVVNHAVEDEGILDEGSEIVVIREDLWLELRNSPALPALATLLEGATSSVSATIGIVRDLPVTIGGITFYVQAQVVTRAPYRILLGRPFYALASAIHHSSRDGAS